MDVKAVEFQFMPHGFMSMKLPFSQGLDESLPAIERSAELLKDMFGITTYDEVFGVDSRQKSENGVKSLDSNE